MSYKRTTDYVLQCQDAWLHTYKMLQWYALPSFANRPSMLDWLLDGKAKRIAAGGYWGHDNPKDAR
jgi:hypothetical protein